MKAKSRKDQRAKRHRRVRRKVHGTAERPRMALMVSDRHMYAQFVNDDAGVTLVSVSTRGAGIAKNVEGAKALGARAAEAAKVSGITAVVVDRGGFTFHGRVKAMVDAVNEAGISICRNREKTE